MTRSTGDLKISSILSFLLLLPFAILEVLHNPISRENATGLILLFGLLWLLPTVFILILLPLFRTARGGNSLLANPTKLVFSVVFLALIGSIWVWGFTDQLPCFLGVPNCD